MEQFVAEKDAWLIKFAGFDLGNAAWGRHSVRFGHALSAEAWLDELEQAVHLDWPVVAQKLAVSQRLSIDCYAPDGSVDTIQGGFTRMRTFFLRGGVGETAVHCGSHLTVSGSSMNVSEQSSHVVQTAVSFR